MSIKQFIILLAAGSAAVSSVAALAGGPDAMSLPATQAAPCVDLSSVFSPAFYIDADGGYAFQNWGQYLVNNETIFGYTGAPLGFGITDNSYGGGTAVFDAGFQFFPHINVEAGGIYLPKVTVTGPQLTSGDAAGSSASQYNWAVYAAGKFSVQVPYVSGLSLFTKVGPVWRAMSNVNFTAPGFAGPHSYWTVVYGAGLQYTFSTASPIRMLTGFSANLEWLGIPAYTGGDVASAKTFATAQPNDNILVAGLGYQVAL